MSNWSNDSSFIISPLHIASRLKTVPRLLSRPSNRVFLLLALLLFLYLFIVRAPSPLFHFLCPYYSIVSRRIQAILRLIVWNNLLFLSLSTFVYIKSLDCQHKLTYINVETALAISVFVMLSAKTRGAKVAYIWYTRRRTAAVSKSWRLEVKRWIKIFLDALSTFVARVSTFVTFCQHLSLFIKTL